MKDAYTALVKAQDAQTRVRKGDLSGAITALADSCVCLGRAQAHRSLERSDIDPEPEILKARIAILQMIDPKTDLSKTYEEILLSEN